MAASQSKDGPVMSLINKKLRALEKKLKRILQTEDSVSQGKPLNKDQEELLRSKPSVLTLIEEYKMLRQPLSVALQEELNLTHQHHQLTPPSPPPPQVVEPEKEKEKEEIFIKNDESLLEDLLKLLYFGCLFDVKPQSDFTNIMLTRTHERGCCLTYDYVTDDATDLLGEKDLDMISVLGGLVVSRPVHSSLSHKNALQSCLQHAKNWLANSDQPIEDGVNFTYAALRERLDKILASDYFTTTPEMKAPVEVAAAAGKYVPVQGSSVSSEVTVHTESDFAQYEQKDEEAEHLEAKEAVADQSSSVEEHPKEPELPNASNDTSAQPEQKTEADAEEEQNSRDVESKDQQYIPRRGYPNHRGGNRGGGGGRRGGYSSGRGGRGGRGGGGPQNGRGQYYDQPNYYPRNYYNTRGRGAGAGRGAGGNAYNNHGPARGGHAQAEELRS